MAKSANNTLMWVLIALFIIGCVVWAAWPALAGTTGTTGTTGGTGSSGGTTGGTGSTGGTTSTLDFNKLLKNGVNNSPEVTQLQILMNKVQPTNIIAVDGDFGPNTEKKLKSLTGGITQITLGQAQQLFAALTK